MNRNLIVALLLLLCTGLMIASCSKSNNYSATDHTTGIIKVWTWTGASSGFAKGDTIQHPPPDTTHVPWAKAFSRNISDTSFPILKINGYAISVRGEVLVYRGTDSVHQTVTFDSTLTGAATSVLTYYYARDSVKYIYHEVSGYNATQNQYYQVNDFLHTKAE